VRAPSKTNVARGAAAALTLASLAWVVLPPPLFGSFAMSSGPGVPTAGGFASPSPPPGVAAPIFDAVAAPDRVLAAGDLKLLGTAITPEGRSALLQASSEPSAWVAEGGQLHGYVVDKITSDAVAVRTPAGQTEILQMFASTANGGGPPSPSAAPSTTPQGTH